MFVLAIQMLMGNRVKYLILISVLAFSTLLMTQQVGIFWGVMRWTTTKMRNTQVPIWVVDPTVVQINQVKELRDTDLARVRSVPGVAWALPLHLSPLKAKLYNGQFIIVDFVGIDSATLFGVPSHLLKGKLENLWKADAIIIDDEVVEQFEKTDSKPLDIGDVIDINDHELKIVGIVEGERSIFGYPTVYTTYDRAVEVAPPVRRSLSYILVQPLPNIPIKKVVENIEKETGLRAYTEDNFFWSTIKWYMENTGIPISFGTATVLGFIVGIAVAGQTFYSFVHENIGNLAALRAMGASSTLLQQMIMLQAALAGVIGYGIGLGLAAIFGFSILRFKKLPFVLPWPIPVIVFILIIVICLFAAYLGIRKVRNIDPAEVFRA
jgi:putative ABC transport system permease protein